jgi:RNA polymerase sigma-54 factor
MKPTLQLKLSQHLTLTPQLQQSIRLLQLSTLELNAEVERLLQENPLLEKVDEEESSSAPPPEFMATTVSTPVTEKAGDDGEPAPPDAGDILTGGDGDWSPGSAGSDDDDENFVPQQVATSSLRDHLIAQLALLNVPLRDRQIVAALIDALDDDGYLTTSLEELLELLPEELEFDADELSIALKHLQNMEPAGVGARDAAECLALQLKALPETTPLRAEALRLVQNHLPLLAARDFGKLKRLLHVDDACLRSMRALIMSLSPRPGAGFSKTEANYVIPDVVVRKSRGRWLAALNEAAMPKLRLNRIYADILTRNR